MAENFSDHERVLNDGDDPHGIVANGAAQRLDAPDPQDEVAPAFRGEFGGCWRGQPGPGPRGPGLPDRRITRDGDISVAGSGCGKPANLSSDWIGGLLLCASTAGEYAAENPALEIEGVWRIWECFAILRGVCVDVLGG